MKQSLFDLKLIEFGHWMCDDKTERNKCQGKHTCKFVLDKKFKKVRAVDLRPVRVQVRDQLYVPKRIVF